MNEKDVMRVQEEMILNKLNLIRGQKVMLEVLEKSVIVFSHYAISCKHHHG